MAIKGVYNVNQIANAVNQILKEYSNGVGEKIDVIAGTVAKRGAKKLKVAGSFKDISGDYRTGWRAKKVKGKWVVHNATDYQLTHLLEKGHALAGGGRAKAYPHIKPVEEEMIKEFEEEIRDVLGR